MKAILSLFFSFITCFLAYAVEGSKTFTYNTDAQVPFVLNVPVEDGNYLVTMKIGSKKKAGATFVKAETRRLFVNNLCTAKGEFRTVSFVVNKRDSQIRENGTTVAQVTLKAREDNKLNWDDNINLEISGDAPLVESITIEPASSDVTTIFLCGDSTVVDQDAEPWASWGQMFPWFFDTKVAIANYAESGERADTFRGAGRLRKILSVLKPGDYVFVEFGHNDQKLDSRPGRGAYYFFSTELKTFIEETKAKGGIPVLVSPTHRRNFDTEAKIVETHGDYPAAMEAVAKREGVDFIDLHKMSATFYEALGPEDSKLAFVHYKAGSFPGMPADVADNTHFNTYGAFQLAKCVVGAIQISGMKVAEHIINFTGFNPSKPDAPDSFKWPATSYRDLNSRQVLEKDDMPTASPKAR